MTILNTKAPDTNVSEVERWLSLLAGSSLIAYGLSRRNVSGIGCAAIGGSIVYRGATGHCGLYQAIGVNTADRSNDKGTGLNVSVPYELGTRVDHEIRINKPAAELYRFWRNLENLPRFMDHVQSVRMIDATRSHWIAKAPAGMTAGWDAEIINEVENEVIGWRSLEGADVDNAGSVRFEEQPGGQSTDVKVSLQYNPPAGSVGAAVAKLLGEDPARQIEDDLLCFKELMETGTLSSRRVARSAPSKTKTSWARDAVQNSSEASFPASDPPSWTRSGV
ncbi:MAG: SRPBCC family protein [Bryobacteraceae bacterium]